MAEGEELYSRRSSKHYAVPTIACARPERTRERADESGLFNPFLSNLANERFTAFPFLTQPI